MKNDEGCDRSDIPAFCLVGIFRLLSPQYRVHVLSAPPSVPAPDRNPAGRQGHSVNSRAHEKVTKCSEKHELVFEK